MFESHSGLQFLKKQNVSSPLTRKDSNVDSLRNREVACSARLRILKPVSRGQCHLIHLIILRRFSPKNPFISFVYAYYHDF